ncbi:glutathione S-transferase family protein [Aquipseudomonas alcaligenes]|uniref:glutathione S-transferase family protein n=1 Tax=Aquipseudomonas alcaligenes TaxID=43263 RepID=UPI000780178A|nr:glutathione S-transferase N-terminal domain-containing protein [Pseudomonas alcaligenes]AMR67929.1 glutathione S-transferase [Pseudomonas alcaligenes]
MIELYSANTPNGLKVPIALEELGVEYHLVKVNLSQGEQKRPAFLALNPNGRIPVLVDLDGPGAQPLNLAESGAILLYLAQKHGALLPQDPVEYQRAMEYLFLQVASVGPMFGQAGWFLRSAPEPVPLAIERYRNESLRLTALLDERLAEVPWLAGSSYSIADIMHFSWLRIADYAGVDLDQFPHVRAWVERISARPAVQRALAKLQN